MSGDHKTPPAWTGERYIPEMGGNIRLEHVHRYLLARELTAGKRVLDIACGEGYGSAMLATVATHVFGVDVALEVVAHASSKYGRPNLDFRQGSCEAIPLRENSVDVVVSFETIEHLERHDDMMREIRRVMSPDGLLIISSPDRREYSGVVGNRNQFHLRELDRDEFEQLLRSHFRYVALAGQRVSGGSIVGPIDAPTETRFVTFPSSDADATGVQGLHAPVYLLALACDLPVPAMPVGLVDGGPLEWASDLASLLAKVQGQCAVEIARRFGDAIQLEGASIETIRTEFVRQADRVSELSHMLRLGRHLLEANAKLGEENVALAAAKSELVASRAMNKAHAASEEWLQRKVRRLEADLGSAEQFHAQIAALRSHVAALQAQVDTYEHSYSWRLTAPLREVRRRFVRARLRAQPRLEDPATSPTPFKQPAAPQGVQETSLASMRGAENGTLPKWLYDEGTTDYVPLDISTPVETRVKLIAFYLPQFHPIPENDGWWGKGFTEWTSVTRGKPQFEGHYQPHLPGELGFYDLRLPGVQQRQIELARLYGLYGFCYYHYWFNGRKLLQQPLEQLLVDAELDFPFCLCWANENWTRRWDGLENEVLIAQEHSAEDDLAFIRDIEPALRDRRYIRVGGRPLLMVYRPALLPAAGATAERWRTYCREVGIGELFLMSTHAFDRRDPRDFGFDAALEFSPISMLVSKITTEIPHINPDFRGVVYDYRNLVEMQLDREPPEGYPLFRSVAPMWDNEARRPSRGDVFAHSSPVLYRKWLEAACRWTERHVGVDKPIVFVNAWNEWAEGTHLEPDRRYGYAYLRATAEALEQFPVRASRPSIVCVSHDAYLHGAQLIALHLVRTLVSALHYGVEVVLCGPGPLTKDFEAISRVHDFWSPAMTREAKLEIIRHLYDQGARVAICNTAAVGEAVELFKLAGFAVVSLVHELPQLIRDRKLEPSLERTARHADKVVFPARMVRDSIRSLVDLPSERCVVQPQGLFSPNGFLGRREAARQQLRTQLGLSEHTRIVLGVGFADHRKGIDWFTDVGLRVAARTDDVVFVWVGAHDPSAFGQVRAIIDAAGASARFVFPGPIRNTELFYAGADAYLMTSREDPFPSVIMEALDGGLPVIGFEGAGGFVELLQRGSGVLVPFGNIGEMATVLLRILSSPAESERLANVGRAILAREFSYVNYTRALVELVKPGGPRVSVVVPNYNYARYLPSRLESIVNQTYPPHEVIFLDDCSSDSSVDVAAEMLHASGLSYRIFTNDANQGTYRQWLRGFREATGDLIWIAEADDACTEDLLERLVAQFERPDVVLAYSQSRQIDGEGNEIAPDYLAYTSDISVTKWCQPYVRPGLDEICDTLVVKNTIPNVSAVLMRRPDLSSIEQQLIGLRNTGDWLLYVHLLEKGSIAFVPESLNFHRRHRGSITIGHGGLNLMREILMVQQYVLGRHGIAADTERKREANLQSTYEYLGLHTDGPTSYRDHDALRVVEPIVAG